MTEMINSCTIFVGNLEGKRPLWRSRHRWEDNIKTYLKIKYQGEDWICLAVVNMAMNLRFP
jgi:hypothetical protein